MRSSDRGRVLYLITHAHTDQQRRTQPTQWRLSALGRRQAADLAAKPFWDEVTSVWTSSEVKTLLTVQPVLDHRPLPVHRSALFDELHRAGWTDDYAAHVAQVFAHPGERIGGWESADLAQARILDGVEMIRRAAVEGAAALVGHGLTLSLYRAHLLRQPAASIDDWRSLSFAAVACVDLDSSELLADFVPASEPVHRA